MKSYTYSEARQNFATLLEEALKDGAVRIVRRSGESFLLTPERPKGSSLDVAGVTPAEALTVEEIARFIHEGRRDYE